VTKQSSELFVGPRPYEQKNAKVFFGREREARDLLSLVIANSLLLIHAPSGAGKTSLLNARLVPMLSEVKDPELIPTLGKGRGFEVLPIARVSGLVPASINSTPGANIYVFNTLVSWRQKDRGQRTDQRKLEESELLGLRLSDYLQHTRPTRQSNITDDEEEVFTRIVIFDQFEEIFTSHLDRWADRQGFFEQVTDAIAGGPVLLRRSDLKRPNELLKKLERADTPLSTVVGQQLSRTEIDLRDEVGSLLGLLNEIIQGPKLSLGETTESMLPAATAAFLKQSPRTKRQMILNRMLLEDAFPEDIYRRATGDPALRVVFSMREDYIAELEPYAHLLPGRLDTRYRLERLRRDAALIAVNSPLAYANLRFAPGVADQLVDNLLKTPVRAARN